MVKPIKHDLNGYPYRGKAVVAKLESGLKINSGNTRAMNNESYDKFMNMVYSIVPWESPSDKSKPIIWRSILLIMIIFMRCTIDGILTEKWNEYYHWTCIVEEEQKICDENTNEDFMNHYQLSIGDTYWKNPHPLMVVLCGDGSDIPKTNADTGSFALAKFHIFTHEHLQQTLMIATLFMFAGLSHYEQIVIDCYQKCSKKLGKDGGFAVFSEKARCKMLVDWFRYDNGDWPWVATIVQKCFHHSADYPFIYWLKYIGKTYITVKKTHEKMFKAVKAGIKDEHMPWNLNIDDIKDTDNFYTLAQEEHFEYWQKQVEEFIDNLPNVDQLTKEQKHMKRRNYAHDHGIPLLYETSVVLVQYCLDLTHAILRIVSFWICVLVILLFCIYVRTIAEVCTVLSHLCMYCVHTMFRHYQNSQ